MTTIEIRNSIENEYNAIIEKIEECKALTMRTKKFSNVKYAFAMMNRLKDAGYKVIRTTGYTDLIVSW